MTTLRLGSARLARPTWLSSPRLVAGMLVLAALGLRVWTPHDDPAATVCLFRRCTGTACPGCGLTRAMAHLVRGDIATAWAYHPLAILVAAEAVVATSLWWLTTSGRIRFDWLRIGTAWLAVHIPLLVVVWLTRWATGTLPS